MSALLVALLIQHKYNSPKYLDGNEFFLRSADIKIAKLVMDKKSLLKEGS
ncbi:MAG: hypothetical protein WAL24_06365 [Nitrososphaeraceae archaeon]